MLYIGRGRCGDKFETCVYKSLKIYLAFKFSPFGNCTFDNSPFSLYGDALTVFTLFQASFPTSSHLQEPITTAVVTSMMDRHYTCRGWSMSLHSKKPSVQYR